MQAVTEATWLHQVKEKCWAYAGKQQAGGRYDAVSMVIALVIAVQLRTAMGLPSLLQKADLLHGYDLVWRAAVKLGLWKAGVQGLQWLYADSALGLEAFRVRLSSVVGQLCYILEKGVGQGRVTGNALFAILLGPLLTSAHHQCPGTAIQVDQKLLNELAANPSTDTMETLDADAVGQAINHYRADPHGELRQMVVDIKTQPEKQAFLDWTAIRKFLMIQFVDDSFDITSSGPMQARLNKTMTRFCFDWQHRFQGGKKGPQVLPINRPELADGEAGTLCGTKAIGVPKMTTLGILLDKGMSFEPLMSAIMAKMLAQSQKLALGMEATGFGLPFVSANFESRTLSSALYGCEMLASYLRGWPTAAKK